jgi:endogenous inhibitor of DNA gyrase (YacG/DUF329 family)
MLYFKCPETGKPVPSGIAADENYKEQGNSVGTGAASCPHCGKTHTYNGDDLFFVKE